MTDHPQWQSPGSSGPPASGAPGGGFVPPVFGQHAPPPPVQHAPPPTQTGWVPPPKPGLIPLRPLDFGTILAAPFQALRRNPRPTFGVSLLIQGGSFFLVFVVIGIVSVSAITRLQFSTNADATNEIAAGAIGSGLLAALIPIALSLVATAIMQGIIVLEVARQSVGEKLRFGQLWARAKGRLGAIIGFALGLTAVALVAVGILVGIVVVLSLAGSTGIAIGVVLAVVLGLGFLVASAWIGTKLALVPSIIMLERASIRRAVTRSWQLTDGAFWRTFGILLLVAFIVNIASSIVSAPLQLLAPIAGAVFSPTGDQTALMVVFGVAALLTVMASLVVSAVTLVIQSATTALLYIDQRMRKEGLDLELSRYVEAKQSGGSNIADPYEHVVVDRQRDASASA